MSNFQRLSRITGSKAIVNNKISSKANRYEHSVQKLIGSFRITSIPGRYTSDRLISMDELVHLRDTDSQGRDTSMDERNRQTRERHE